MTSYYLLLLFIARKIIIDDAETNNSKKVSLESLWKCIINLAYYEKKN